MLGIERLLELVREVVAHFPGEALRVAAVEGVAHYDIHDALAFYRQEGGPQDDPVAMLYFDGSIEYATATASA